MLNLIFVIFQVEKDIIKNLKLNRPFGKFKVPCFRKNLYYDVVFKDILDDDVEHLKAFIDKCLAQTSKTEKKVNQTIHSLFHFQTIYLKEKILIKFFSLF